MATRAGGRRGDADTGRRTRGWRRAVWLARRGGRLRERGARSPVPAEIPWVWGESPSCLTCGFPPRSSPRWSGGADAPRGRGGRPVGSRTGGRTLAGGVGSGPAHHGAAPREAPPTGKPPNATRDPPRTAPRDGPSESGGGRRGVGDGGMRDRVGGVGAPGPGASRREHSRGGRGASRAPFGEGAPTPPPPAPHLPAAVPRTWGRCC